MVGQLGSYALLHLSTEEEFFTKTGYPDVEAHLLVHNQFRAKAQRFINQVRDEQGDLKRP